MRTNIGRFSDEDRWDLDREVFSYCDACGGEIYEGEKVFLVGKDVIHSSMDCLYRWASPKIATTDKLK